MRARTRAAMGSATGSATGWVAVLLSALLLPAAGGCGEYNATPTRAEADAIAGVVPLTVGHRDRFDKAGDARFSADTKWVVFRAVPHGEPAYQVYVAKVKFEEASVAANGANANGGSRRAWRVVGLDRPVRVTPAGSSNGGACFSPDGFSVVFASDAGGGRGGRPVLFRADNWEANVTAALTATGPDQPAAVNLAANRLTDGSDPAFSPDGRTVCFARGDGLYAMRPDGSAVTRITSPGGTYAAPAFSPDGRSLVYLAATDRGADARSQVCRGDLAFGSAGEIAGLTAEKPLTRDDAHHSAPCWFPDGRHVAYATDRDDRDYELYVMDRDGNRKTRVTFHRGPDLFPAFSPDWRYLMWTTNRGPDGTDQLFAAEFTLPAGS